MLHREIFTPAKGTTNGRIAYNHLIFRELKDLGNLATIFMKPLSGGFNHDSLLFIKVGNASFCLEEVVFLPGGVKGFFKHHIIVSHRRSRIAFAERKMQTLVV